MNLKLDNIEEAIALDSVIENGLSNLTVARPTLEVYRELIKRGDDMPFSLEDIETQIRDGALLEDILKTLSRKVGLILDQFDNDGKQKIEPPKWK